MCLICYNKLKEKKILYILKLILKLLSYSRTYKVKKIFCFKN